MRAFIVTFLAATTVTTTVAAQSDSTWRDHNRAADAATTRRDWADARRHMLAMDSLLGGHPSVAMALARTAVRSGDTAEAWRQLGRVGAMGVIARTADTAFDRVRALPSFQAAERAIAGNTATIGRADVVATIPDSGAIAEDLVFEPSTSRFIVSDVRRHRIRSVGLDGTIRDLVVLPPGWAALGLAIDAPRGVVWATAVTLAQAEGYTPADSGRSAILRIDVATGAITKRFDLPAPSRGAPGDLAVAENHDVFVGDGMAGAIYVVRAQGDSLQALVAPGRLRSTQQPALPEGGRALFVPEYARGIARVDRATGAITWLGHAPGVTLTGIDGLIARGRDLIAVQNNVNPNRIVRLVLDAAGTSVVRADVILRDSVLLPEPTHVIQSQGVFYAIGNAGWSKYRDDGTPDPSVTPAPPRIVRFTTRP